MAKRDKLYTVNKWNRPFFEQERRKKLYGIGGSTDNYVWGLNTDQGLTRAGIAQAPVDAGWKRNMPGWASNGEQTSNPWREVVTTYAAVPTENATPAGNLNQ